MSTASDRSQPGAWRTAIDQIKRRSLRGVKRLVRPLWMRRLQHQNLQGAGPVAVPGSAGPVVSLTTFGQRIEQVHYTVESIAAGTLLPSRLMLWVDAVVLQRGLPAALQRLVARGLEVRGCQDVGPHTKYFPAVNALPADRALVTADDDVLYPRRWLAGLVQASRADPTSIVCYRAHVVSFATDGSLAPYDGWPACRSTLPSPRHFVTGVAGALYPARMQLALREAGDAFLACCPRADDIWLNAIAWRTRVPVRQITPFHPVLFELPGSRSTGLARHNVQGGGNDEQLRATFSAAELAALRASH
ncbi:MAG TPA: hypothetical protein VIW70_10610 [Rubrivivax sp.]